MFWRGTVAIQLPATHKRAHTHTPGRLLASERKTDVEQTGETKTETKKERILKERKLNHPLRPFYYLFWDLINNLIMAIVVNQ